MTLIILFKFPLFIEEIQSAIVVNCPFIQIFGKCYTLEDGMKAALELKPEILMLDLAMKSALEPSKMDSLLNLRTNIVPLVSGHFLRNNLHTNGIEALQTCPLDTAQLVCMLNYFNKKP